MVTREPTLAEKLMMRAWLEEIDAVQPVPGDGSAYRMRRAAERTGVSVSRIHNLIRAMTYEEREACR